MIIRQQPKCFICALEALPSFSTILRPSTKVIKAKKKAPAQDGRKKKKMMKQTCYSASSKSAIQPKKKTRKNEKQNWTMCCIVHHLLWMCIQLRQFFVFFVSFLLSYSQQSDTSFQEKFHHIGQGIFKTEEWWRTTFCYKLWKSITGWTEQGGLDKFVRKQLSSTLSAKKLGIETK